MKTDNLYITHKLPLIERKEKAYKLFGQHVERLQKDLKAKREEIEVVKKLALIKFHQLATNGMKVAQQLRVLKQENDAKDAEISDQKKTIEYLEKAIDLEKRAELEQLGVDIKEKFQQELAKMILGKHSILSEGSGNASFIGNLES